MRVEEFVSQGHAEPVKGAIHGLAAIVCGLMSATSVRSLDRVIAVSHLQ